MGYFPRRDARLLALLSVPLLLLFLLVPALHAQEDASPSDRVDVRGVITVLYVDDFVAGSASMVAVLHLEDGAQLALESAIVRAEPIDLRALNGMAVVVETSDEALDAALHTARSAEGGGVASLPVYSVRIDRASTDAGALASRGASPAVHASAVNETGVKRLRYANLLCSFTDGDAAPPAPPTVASWFDPALSNSYSHYYRTVSYGNLIIEFVTATQWRTMPVSFASLRGSGDLAISDALKRDCLALFADQMDSDLFDGFIFFTNVDFGGYSFAGTSVIPTATDPNRLAGVVYLSYFLGLTYGHTVVVHEIGHSLGEPHTFLDHGNFRPYHNMWDVMSGQPCYTPDDDWTVWETCVSTDFIAYHKLEQGWIPPSRILTASEGISTVVKLDWLAEAESTSNYAIAVLPVAHGLYYTVEARRAAPTTYDRAVPGTALLVHEVVRGRTYEAYQVAAISPGAASPANRWYSHDFGVMVELVGAQATGLEVRIVRNAAALQDAPAPPLVVTIDDSSVGTIGVSARIQNLTGGNWGRPEVDLETGLLLNEYYAGTDAPNVSNVTGGYCNSTFHLVYCELPPIAANTAHTITFALELTSHRTHVFRSATYPDGFDPNSRTPTVVNFATPRTLPNLRVSIQPETQTIAPTMALDFDVKNVLNGAARDVQVVIDFPAELALPRPQYQHLSVVGIAEPQIDTTTWPHLAIDFAEFPADAHWSFSLDFSSYTPPATAWGEYPVQMRVTQSAQTPDADPSDNEATAVLCTGVCGIPTHRLALAFLGEGAGTVTFSSGTPASCSNACVHAYGVGEMVTLTAAPASGSTFAGWSGACSGTSPTCTVHMDGARNVTANFARVTATPRHTLTVVRAGSGSGTVTSAPAGIDCGADCSEAFAQGTTVSLAATPAAGSTFEGWSGACSGTDACIVTMNQAQSVSATFGVATTGKHQLLVAKEGSGAGSVTSAPAGINCGSACAFEFNQGARVTLTATPAAGSTFAGWSGACSGTGACIVAMSDPKTVTARFIIGTPAEPDSSFRQMIPVVRK